jgi:hypothetical protein
VAQQIHEATEQTRLRQGGNTWSCNIKQQHIGNARGLGVRAAALGRSIGVRHGQ